MKLNKNYIGIRDRWWALPLILPSLLLPILSTANTYAHISTGNVILFYLPLALMISLMLFFWLGGITRNYHFHHLVQISAGWVI
ncbi:signal transduction protein [Citrobacter braakii]|nr:signal transduction protein [Citrobacter braakii]